MKKNFYIIKNKESNIVINEYQLKNPCIKDFFFQYKVETNLLCDFKISEKFFCFYLSMKYHEAFPLYIESKLSQNIPCKILFCMYDLLNKEITIDNFINSQEFKFKFDLANSNFNLFTENINDIKSDQQNNIEKILTDLNFLCLNNKTLLIICNNSYDLCQYIYALSQIDNIEINEKVKSSNEEELTETLCIIDKINKTDAGNLLVNFNNIKTLANTSGYNLSNIPGITNNKKISIIELFNYNLKKFN